MFFGLSIGPFRKVWLLFSKDYPKQFSRLGYLDKFEETAPNSAYIDFFPTAGTRKLEAMSPSSLNLLKAYDSF